MRGALALAALLLPASALGQGVVYEPMPEWHRPVAEWRPFKKKTVTPPVATLWAVDWTDRPWFGRMSEDAGTFTHVTFEACTYLDPACTTNGYKAADTKAVAWTFYEPNQTSMPVASDLYAGVGIDAFEAGFLWDSDSDYWYATVAPLARDFWLCQVGVGAYDSYTYPNYYAPSMFVGPDHAGAVLSGETVPNSFRVMYGDDALLAAEIAGPSSAYLYMDSAYEPTAGLHFVCSGRLGGQLFTYYNGLWSLSSGTAVEASIGDQLALGAGYGATLIEFQGSTSTPSQALFDSLYAEVRAPHLYAQAGGENTPVYTLYPLAVCDMEGSGVLPSNGICPAESGAQCVSKDGTASSCRMSSATLDGATGWTVAADANPSMAVAFSLTYGYGALEEVVELGGLGSQSYWYAVSAYLEPDGSKLGCNASALGSGEYGTAYHTFPFLIDTIYEVSCTVSEDRAQVCACVMADCTCSNIRSGLNPYPDTPLPAGWAAGTSARLGFNNENNPLLGTIYKARVCDRAPCRL